MPIQNEVESDDADALIRDPHFIEAPVDETDEDDLTAPYLIEPTPEELAATDEPEVENLNLGDILQNIDADDTISLYLKEVSQTPILSTDEQIELTRRIERGRMARVELAGGTVSKKQKQELTRLTEDGKAARDHLVTSNARLVISVAKKYMGWGVPFLDLIQEGNIGLIRATKKFDYRRGEQIFHLCDLVDTTGCQPGNYRTGTDNTYPTPFGRSN